MFVDFNKYKSEIIGYELNKDRDILILKTNMCSFKITAYGDCCSFSVIKCVNGISFDSLIGKIIKRVKEVIEINDDIKADISDTDDDDDDDCINEHIYKIEFINSDEIFYFAMVNYSNGYYDGWISIDTCF